MSNFVYTVRKLKPGRPGKDFTGHRFGRLTVLSLVGRAKVGKSVHRVWLCYCDCGCYKEIVQGHFAYGSTTSCGCYQREKAATKLKHRILPVGEAFMNSLFRRYRQQAKERGREFTLTREQFEAEIVKPCYYCGAEPVIPAWAQKSTGWKGYSTWNGVVPCNGLDRVDNAVGYTQINVVAACSTCNLAKTDMPIQEFVAWARRLVKWQDRMSTSRIKAVLRGSA